MTVLDKTALMQVILDKFEADYAQLVASAEATRKGATHEEAKPENDKDTRAIEASYLARGQAMRVEEMEESITRLRFLKPRDFAADDPVDVGALVEVDVDGELQRFFLVPVGGGASVELAGHEVRLLTPASPVGQRLAGKYVGDDFEMQARGRVRSYEILAVR